MQDYWVNNVCGIMSTSGGGGGGWGGVDILLFSVIQRKGIKIFKPYLVCKIIGLIACLVLLLGIIAAQIKIST